RLLGLGRSMHPAALRGWVLFGRGAVAFGGVGPRRVAARAVGSLGAQLGGDQGVAPRDRRAAPLPRREEPATQGESQHRPRNEAARPTQGELEIPLRLGPFLGSGRWSGGRGGPGSIGWNGERAGRRVLDGDGG